MPKSAPKRNNKRNNRRNNRRKTSRPKTTKYSGAKSFAKKRAPMVECKKLTFGVGVGKVSYTSPVSWIPNRSYVEYQRGFKNGDVLGSDIFSKYYSMKVKFDFPRDNFSIPEQYRMYLIHGWMTAPFGLPVVPASPYQLERDTVTFSQLEQKMIQLIQHEWNDGQDEMEFRTKEKKLYKILGKQLITPNRNRSIGLKQTASVLVEGSTADEMISGGPPSVMKQLHWKPMKKVRLTETAGLTSGGSGGFLYPNQSWIPFAFVYAPDHLNLKHPNDDPLTPPVPEAMVTMSYNDCHWYTDS